MRIFFYSKLDILMHVEVDPTCFIYWAHKKKEVNINSVSTKGNHYEKTIRN